MSTNGQTVLSEDVVATLDTAAAKIAEEREQFEQEVAERRQQFDFREQMIKQAKEGLEMAFGDISFPSEPSGDDEVPKLSISQKHLEDIEKYLASHGKARQADLVEKLSLNSGTVSVGLRRLEMAELIAKRPKERGSRVWEHTAPTDKKRRETVLAVGEGVREGRLIKS